MQAKGYLDSSKMATVFNLLRSNDLIWPYIVNVYQKGKEPLPFDLLYWNSDSTRMPAANHSFYLRHCYLQNDLAESRMQIGGEPIDLTGSISRSMISPPARTISRRQNPCSPVHGCSGERCASFSPAPVISPGSSTRPDPRSVTNTGPGSTAGELEGWLKNAQEHPGSWWPDWQSWVEQLDGEKVAGQGNRRRQAETDRGGTRQLREGQELIRPKRHCRVRARSKRSAFITLVHAATKSFTNFSFESRTHRLPRERAVASANRRSGRHGWRST